METHEPAVATDRLPFSFVIGAAQKAGTTSLSDMLDQHPNVQKAPLKELHYFDQEDRDWSNPDFSDYAVPREGPGHRIVGDATPLYLWWPQALDRMHAYNPDMKFLAIFRDPVERLFSQWMMTANRWPKRFLDWPDFLTLFAPDGLEDRVVLPPGRDIHRYRMHSGIVRGYYGGQLERGFSLFGAEQFHLLEFRAFLRDHTTALDRITDFLGIPRFEEHPELPHSHRSRGWARGTAPTAQDISGLVARYGDDHEKFKRLSGLDTSGWPLQQMLDGSLAPEDLAATFATKVRPRQDT